MGAGVDRVEFLVEMLVQMSGLDRKKEIEPWLKVMISDSFAFLIFEFRSDLTNWTKMEAEY